jgi:hypothetical protein
MRGEAACFLFIFQELANPLPHGFRFGRQLQSLEPESAHFSPPRATLRRVASFSSKPQ